MVTWALSAATGCMVSSVGGKYLFKNADGKIIKECTVDEADEILKKIKGDGYTSFADMRSPEDAERYLKFLKDGSTQIRQVQNLKE